MAAIFMDGFDHYGVGGSVGGVNMLAGTWAEVSGNAGPGVPSWGSRTGLYSLFCQTSGLGSFRYAMPVPKNAVFLSCGYSCDGLPSTDLKNVVATFCDASNTIIARLYVQSNGSLALYGVSNNLLAATAGPVIVSRSWHFLEMTINRSAGTFVLRIDDATGTDTPAINASGLSLGSNPVGQIRVLDNAAAGATVGWMDDLFLRDTTGSINNSWLGDRRVATLIVDADGPDQGWAVNRYTKLGTGILNCTAEVFSVKSAVIVPTATSLNIGAGDFTIEGFVRFQSLPTGSNKATIFSRWSGNDNQRSYELFLGSQALNGGSLCWQTSTDGTNSTVSQPIVYPWTPDLDTWYHIAINRSSGELLLFVNGQQFGLPIADSNTYFAGTSPYGLMGETQNGGTPIVANTQLIGWMDETRFTNGFCRYTSNFTPTTTEFPRGSPADPQWASVVLLAGFDTLIQDESGFARTMTALSGAVQQTTNDGVFAFPTVGKQVPDDNTFITAPFIAASGILTITANASAGNSVTIGTTDGSTPAVYTFRASVSTAFDVAIGGTIQDTLQNLYNAVNAGPGSGTAYGTGTTVNFDVTANQLPAGQMQVVASTAGTVGNTVPTTLSGLTGSWSGSTLSGGVDIPGPSSFFVERLPPHVTIISAVQIDIRASKSDSGLGSIQSSFVGPLGASLPGDVHNLTVNPVYYTDMFETDPDTSGPISPTTVNSGSILVDRTA